MPIGLLIGLGAGLASALMFISASTGGLVGVFVLFCLSPLPIAIAGLGWGWVAAAIAAAAGAVLVLVIGSERAALIHALAIGAPAAVFSYLLLLSRQVIAPAPDGGTTIEWYPIGRVIAWAAIWAGLLAALAMLSIATDKAGLHAVILEVFDKALTGAPPMGIDRPLTADEKAQFATLMVHLFPWAIATCWFLVAVVNMWVAGHITRVSGRLTRPWPDLAEIALPPLLPLGFAGALLLTLLPDMAALIASGFVHAFLFAFMLVGLATLHRLTRTFDLRPIILTMVYAALIFFPPLSTLFVAMIGFADPYLRRRLPPSQPPA